MQVWFAHKPVCGPGKADFAVLPALTTVETHLVQSPAFRHAILTPTAPDGPPSRIGQVIEALEIEFNLPAGSFLQMQCSVLENRCPTIPFDPDGDTAQNLPRINEWLDSLAPNPQLRNDARMAINSALSAVAVAGGPPSGRLVLAAHSFAIAFWTWYEATQSGNLPRSFARFLHAVTISVGLMQVLTGRVAGADSSRVTPELVRANLERALRAVQGDVDLSMDATGGGFLDVIAELLKSIPGMDSYSVHLSTIAGDRNLNMISLARPDDTAHSQRFVRALRDRLSSGTL